MSKAIRRSLNGVRLLSGPGTCRPRRRTYQHVWPKQAVNRSTAAVSTTRVAKRIHATAPIQPSHEGYAVSCGLLEPLSDTMLQHPILSQSGEQTGHDILQNSLINCKVEKIFGVPGQSIRPGPFNNIWNSKTLDAVIASQEQGTGHMAEGYARATGKPGVVLVTSPYGITSLVTPMQDALCDGTPMVVLSSLSPSISLGRDEFQVPDTLGIASACTKWSSRVAQIGELEQKINDAFEIALSGRPGPVLVDIPASIMNEQLHHPYGMSPLRLRRLPPISTGVLRMPPQDLDQTLTEVARLVDGARKPVLYVGQGMLARPEGPAILKEFADKANIPVTTSLQGLGAFDEHDPKSLHMLGLHGSGYANLAVQEADLIIALGARFDDRVTGSIPKFAPQALAAAFENRGGIVHFDIAPKNVNKVVQATEVVLGDCATNLKQLIPRIQRVSDRPEWFSQIRHWKKRFPLSAYAKHNPSKSIKPQAAIQKLSEMTDHMKDRVIISTGVGQHQMWAAQHYRWRHPRTMLTSGGLGTMGYGLPAAIGAKVARPDCLVIDIDGDASLSMSLAELATAARYNIAVKVLLLNNEGMGMVSDLQRMYYAERFAHCRQENPDFVLASQGFGVAADRVVSPADLEQKLTWLIEHDGPALLEVVTERNTPVWPVVPSGKGLHEFVTYPEVVD